MCCAQFPGAMPGEKVKPSTQYGARIRSAIASLLAAREKRHNARLGDNETGNSIGVHYIMGIQSYEPRHGMSISMRN